MRLSAYILAADPTWIEQGVRSYYDLVDRIVVSYDRRGRGWTGRPLDIEQCLERARALDRDRKMIFAAGDFACPGSNPLEAETRQRQQALSAAASHDPEWVLQLDPDEVLPRPAELVKVLDHAAKQDIPAVEWPMRLLYHRAITGEYLEVCAPCGADRFEYPAPVAVRPDVRLISARRARGRFLRPVVLGDRHSLQVCRKPETGEVRFLSVASDTAIIHNSWARTPSEVKSKIGSWGHNVGWKTRAYYYLRWRPAPLLWRCMRDFHPFSKGLWPALKVSRSVTPAMLQGGAS